MSCVLRLSSPRLEEYLPRLVIQPYRVEAGTAHFQISICDFTNFSGQVIDAIAYLQKNGADLNCAMSAPDADGVLDFAVELNSAAFQFNSFPATLVREAGNLGLALEISHYPGDRTL